MPRLLLRLPRTTILLCLLSGIPMSVLPEVQSTHLEQPLVGVWNELYRSNVVNDTSLTSGTITFSVNVTEVDNLAAFDIRLRYNPETLQALTIETDANLLGPGALTLERCGSQEPCYDGIAVIRIAQVILGGTVSGSGFLFRVTFEIRSSGFSELHLFEDILIGSDVNGDGQPDNIAHTNEDGSFSNVAFSPPLVSFDFRVENPLPGQDSSIPFEGQTVVFDASASRDPNPGGGIVAYLWDFGDGTTIVGEADPIVQHVFCLGETGCIPGVGNFTVTLTVRSMFGLESRMSRIVEVEPSPPICPSGLPSVRVPRDCPTMGSAIRAVVEGGTVFVEAGTYKENLYIDKPLSLLGAGSDDTIVEGGLGRTVTVQADEVRISGFTIIGRGIDPTANFLISDSNRVVVSDNTVKGGVVITRSREVELRDNLITESFVGLRLSGPFSTTLRRNIMRNNTFSLDIAGGTIHDIDTSNTIENRTVYYLVGARNIQIPDDPGYLALINSHDITVGPLSISGVGQGILVDKSSSIRISNLEVGLVIEGVAIYDSTEITLERSRTSGRCSFGATLFRSNQNDIFQNSFFCRNGIMFSNSTDNRIVANMVSSEFGETGIYIAGSARNRFSGNHILGYNEGIVIGASPSNVFEGNVIDGTEAMFGLRGTGVAIFNSPRNIFRDNQIRNSLSGLVIDSNHFSFKENFPRFFRLLEDYVQDIDPSNTLNGKPIHYLVNQHQVTIPSTAGFVGIVNSTDIVVRDLELAFTGNGLLIISSFRVLVERLRLSYVVQEGVLVWSSTDFTLKNIQISHASSVRSGISVEDSRNGLLRGNVINYSLISKYGILLSDSTGIDIEGNLVSGYDVAGIRLSGSSGNIIRRNTVKPMFTFIGLGPLGIGVFGSTENLIVGNTIAGNSRGFDGFESHGNILYYNNFIANTVQASGSGNTWDNGAGEGNFWSDYQGDDLNGDGIGDTLLPHLGLDDFPLVAPWTAEALSVDFSGRAAWPEHRRYDMSMDEDAYQTLFARATNTGSESGWVQAIFTITFTNRSQEEILSDPTWLGAGSTVDLSALFQPSPGVFSVSVRLRFSSDAFLSWIPVLKSRPFTFTAV